LSIIAPSKKGSEVHEELERDHFIQDHFDPDRQKGRGVRRELERTIEEVGDQPWYRQKGG
jgi:hypothetical protein